jgi:hypothetical protein
MRHIPVMTNSSIAIFLVVLVPPNDALNQEKAGPN